MRKQEMPCRAACLLLCLYTLASLLRNIKSLDSCWCIAKFFRTSMPFLSSKIVEVHYAIVDIETTGGYAAANGIIGIAIQVLDGQDVVEKFETLVKPGQNIPRYIQAFTGIDNEMVADAPCVEETAEEVFTMLQGNI